MGQFIGDLFKEKKKSQTSDNTTTTDFTKELQEAINSPKKIVLPKQEEKPKDITIQKIDSKQFKKIQNTINTTKDIKVDSLDESEKTVVAKYNQVTIYKIKGSTILHYEIPTPKANTREQEIIDTIKEAATRIISLAPYKIRDEKQRWNVYYQKVMEIISSSPELKIPEGMSGFYAESVVREMVGFGKIDLLLKDDLLEEVMIIGPNHPVYVFHRQYEMMTTNIVFYTDKEIQDIVGRIARYAGRRIDYSQPLLDARLSDGSRINATLPPASVAGSTLTVRKFRKDPYTIVDLINNNTLDSYVAGFLWTCVEGLSAKPANIVISGGTGSGKTTTLNVLCSLIPKYERIISIEDTAELNLPLTHWIRLEARPPGIEGTGEITLDMLTKNALRMRPDRIIVGEVRGSEAEALFTAMNTGHDGCLTGDTKIAFTDGIETISYFVDSSLKNNKYLENEWEVSKVSKKYVNSLDENGKVVKCEVVEARRKKYFGKILKIKLASGSEIKVTPNHPFYTLNNNIDKVSAENLKENQFLATPNMLIFDFNDKNNNTEYWDGLLPRDLFNMPARNKQKMQLYKIQYSTPDIVSGFFDAEGHTDINNSDLGFTNANTNNIDNIRSTLLTQDVVSIKCRSESEKNIWDRFYVYGLKNLKKFYNNFGIKFHEKANKPHKLLNSEKVANTNSDVVPCDLILQNLFNIAKRNKISERLIARASNISQSSLRAYRKGIRNPSKKQLRKIAKGYEKLGIKNNLLKIANANILWDKISSITTENYSGYVYDLTVSESKVSGKKPHNFVAESIFVGNSMGTLHANTSDETVVRITNPPMNVPRMMLAGLDMIIVQNRLHDRQKGTIRRIVEISEISGFQNEDIKTQRIFEWDPKKDKIYDTSIPSKVLKNISTYSGRSTQNIKDEIDNRAQFFELLLEKNIRKKDDIAKYVEKYYDI